MAILVKFDSSPMGEHSISRKLTSQFADTWLKAHSGGTVISRDLTALDLPAVDAAWVAAAFTPEEARTSAQSKLLSISDGLIADLLLGDEFVFGIPMHNFSIPSTLKLWIDQVVRAGKTFSYGSSSGPKGLLAGKKAALLIASGGAYEAGSPLASFNFVTPYLLKVFGFIGITDVTIIPAESTSQLMTGKVDRQAFLAPLLEKVKTHATI
jgi:FMN-dependent NADH-azoreductase